MKKEQRVDQVGKKPKRFKKIKTKVTLFTVLVLCIAAFLAYYFDWVDFGFLGEYEYLDETKVEDQTENTTTKSTMNTNQIIVKDNIIRYQDEEMTLETLKTKLMENQQGGTTDLIDLIDQLAMDQTFKDVEELLKELKIPYTIGEDVQ